MPLKLKLAAHESLIVNGAVMVNGGCRTTLIIRNFAQILREKDVLQEPDANTPTKRLYFIVQAMLMQPPPSDELLASYRLAHTQLSGAYVRSENLAVLRDVDRLVGLGDCYKAMMKLHPLIEYEAGLLNVPRHEWRRAAQRVPGERGPGERGPGERPPADRGPGGRGPGERGPGERGPGERGPTDYSGVRREPAEAARPIPAPAIAGRSITAPGERLRMPVTAG